MKIVAVDFDGTLCQDKFPDIGDPISSAIRLVHQLQSHDVKVILWTCRNGDALAQAVIWCRKHGLVFDAVNENLPDIQEMFGGNTRKIFADLYWDDKNATDVEIYERVIEDVGAGNNRQSAKVAQFIRRLRGRKSMGQSTTGW